MKIAVLTELILTIAVMSGWAYYSNLVMSISSRLDALDFKREQELLDSAKDFNEYVKDLTFFPFRKKLLIAVFFLLNLALLVVPLCVAASQLDGDSYMYECCHSGILAAIAITCGLFWGARRVVEFTIFRVRIGLQAELVDRVLKNNTLSSDEKISSIKRSICRND